MDEISFLNFDGLDDSQVRDLKNLLFASDNDPEIEFPWSNCSEEEKFAVKGAASSLNVHAAVFETYVSTVNNFAHGVDSHNSSTVRYSNGPNQILNSTPLVSIPHNYTSAVDERTMQHGLPEFSNGHSAQINKTFDQCMAFSEAPKTLNGDVYQNACPVQVQNPNTTFKLNPTVSCFIPQNIKCFTQQDQTSVPKARSEEPSAAVHQSSIVQDNYVSFDKQINGEGDSIAQSIQNDLVHKVNHDDRNLEKTDLKNDSAIVTTIIPKTETSSSAPSRRSWADVVSRGQKPGEKVSLAKSVTENESKSQKSIFKEQESENLSVHEDKMALVLGKHLYQLALDFQPVFLQPRGLINRRNWCYINATLQALLACPPFYTLLRNLPLGPSIDRGKSSTPVIDSMVKVTYEFSQYQTPQEELQPGQPFQPDFIYEMLRDLKSDCLKGQQEDAEEFLSFILNGMHEEMVKIIKNYEKQNHLDLANNEIKENGDVSEGEEEWQVIGSKHKGMVTRKVAEHKTPISDLLGGQIKSFLTTNGNKTSASIQPFFTLQLDIQSENVTNVLEALKEMTVKELIQGYTCTKTKQEVEAYSHVSLQKTPPILILHLKRFVYNKNGGCKKVMKKTDYPIQLELSKDLFSPDVKKNQRLRLYKLFAVMYHDGEEAVKGHYISDVYNHGSQTWVRCDDRAVTVVTEDQVLLHSPPRVPYLLFYQES